MRDNHYSTYLKLPLFGLLLLSAWGCGVGSGEVTPGTHDKSDSTKPNTTTLEKIVKPVIHVAGPAELAVGEPLTIVGQNFISEARGKTTLKFAGRFIDDLGQEYPVDYQGEGSFASKSKVRWRMLPHIVFHPEGDRLGQFVGELRVVSYGHDGTTETSDPISITITIKPSLIPRVITPIHHQCGPLVKTTLEDTPMRIALEAVGLRRGTDEEPLRFFWAFLGNEWDIAFDNGLFDPSSINQDATTFLIEQRITDGATSTVSEEESGNYLLSLFDDFRGQTRLRKMRTKALPTEGDSRIVNLNVTAIDASGKQASLSVPLDVRKQTDVIFSDESRIAKRLQPVLLRECIPGGDIGRHVSFQDTKSESRERSMGFNYNAQVGAQFGLPSNPFLAGFNFSAGFGVDIHQRASSDKAESVGLSAEIHPGEFAAFYRQTSKIHRIAKLVGYTACGAEIALGEAILTDWVFTPDIAKGHECPPPTNLPPAEDFEL